MGRAPSLATARAPQMAPDLAAVSQIAHPANPARQRINAA